MRTIVSHDSLTSLFRALVPEVTVTEVAITVEGILVTAFVPMPSAVNYSYELVLGRVW